MSDPKDNTPQESDDEPDFNVKPMGVGVTLQGALSPTAPLSSDDD
ncbi:TPA: hypothetical protein ACX6RJ_000488 [Photobacterium damselae]